MLDEKDYLREFPDMQPANKGQQPLYQLIESHGVDTAVFGFLMSQYTALGAAVTAGYSISDDELAKGMEEQRRRFNKMGQTETLTEVWSEVLQHTTTQTTEYPRDPKILGYIEAVGEDKFWDEILPAKISHELILDKWYVAAIGGRNLRGEDWNKAHTDLHRAALAGAEIEVMDGDFDLITTQEEAKAFIHEYWDWLDR